MTVKNSKNTRFQWIVLTVLLGFVSAVAGMTAWVVMKQGQSQAATTTLLVLPEPREVADFTLVDHEGRQFSLEQLKGSWSLMFFGFTNCPDVCPNALYNLKQVDEILNRVAEGEPTDHQVVFVSVDPERDTPESLSRYVAYFDPGFIGVTGAEEQLAALTMQLGIAYRIEDHDPGSLKYDVFHSASILLTDPRGRLVGAFPAPHDPQQVAGDLLEFKD